MTDGTNREINMSGFKYFGDIFFKKKYWRQRHLYEKLKRVSIVHPPIFQELTNQSITHSYLRSGGGPGGDFQFRLKNTEKRKGKKLDESQVNQCIMVVGLE
jgi:hypothetical protein